MSNIDALRIRHEHDIPLTTKNIDISQGFTIEAWVKVAPTDPVVRIYPESGYQGNPVKLKAGAYPVIKASHFAGLGSVDLPEGIEAVFFAEKDYKGTPFVMREDQSEIDSSNQQAGSVIVMDRRHGRQSHVVLFEEENYKGEAQLLLVAEEWTIRQQSKGKQKKLLDSVKSAWVPPGVAVDLFSRKNHNADWFDDATDYGSIKLLNMDNHIGVLKDTKVWFNNFGFLDYEEFKGYSDHLGFGGDTSKLVVFEKENFEGAFQILNGRNEDWIKLLELPWYPKSAFRYRTHEFQNAPGEFEGVFVFQKNKEGYHNVYLYQPGLKMLNPHTDDKIWIPPQYRLIPPETTSREPLDPQNPGVKSIIVDKKSKAILKPGLYGNINLENYLVERLDRKSLQGDLSTFPVVPTKIKARRVQPIEGTEMLYTDKNNQEGTTKAKTWASNVPAFSKARLPKGYALYLFEKVNFEGKCAIIVDGRDDFNDLAFAPKSAAYAEASKGINGVLSTEKKGEATAHIYANGEKLPTNFEGKVSIANGYRLYPGPYIKSDPIYGAGYHTNVNLDSYTVERFAGILTTGGFGLLVERKKGKLRGEGEEIRFGERAIRPDRWYHLALTYDGKKVKYLLDGKVIQQEERRDISLGTNWIIGEKFRGAIGQLRVWNRVLEPAQIRDFRFPGKTLASVFLEGAQLPTSLLTDKLSDHTFPPDAVMVTSEVYKDPLNTTFTKHKLNEVKAEQRVMLLEAKKSAAKITGHARKRQQYKIALAHERQRRKIHINGIAKMVFVRGDIILVGSPKGSDPSFVKTTTGHTELNDRKAHGHRVNDSILGEEGEVYLVTDGIKKGIEVYIDKIIDGTTHQNVRQSLIENNKLAGEAIACDFSHKHILASSPGDEYTRTGLYWIETDGAIYNIWAYKQSDSGFFHTGPLLDNASRISERKLPNTPIPLGRPKNWDITIGEVSTHETQIYWTNGWEIFRGIETIYPTEAGNQYDIKNHSFEYELLVPHVASPHPIAIEMAPDGTLIWLDKEAEMIKILTKSQLDSFYISKLYKEPKDLYRAINPSAGLAVCELADVKNSGENVTYVYWVSAERKVLEVPVIDTPGQYIDFWYDEKFPYKHGQHVDEVPVIDTIGAEFIDASKVIPFKSDRGTIYGPFDVNEGFSIKIKLYLKNIYKPDLFLSFLLKPVWFLTDYSFQKIDREPFSGINSPLPNDEWFELEIRIDKDEGHSRMRIYQNNRLRNTWPDPEYRDRYDIMEGQQYVYFKFPADPLGDKIGAEGYFSELTVTSLKDNSILAKRDLNTPKSEKVRPLKPLIDPIVIDGVAPSALPTKVLSMTDVNDVVLFDSVRLDFKNGFTVSADLMMSKDSKNDTPICVYELGTFEDETRLVCGFDTKGHPRLFLRWKGDRIRFLKMGLRGEYIKKNERKRVTWAMTAEGYVTTYIEGIPSPIINEQLDWKSNEPCVFENHRLGAPNDIQTHIQIEDALAYNRVDSLLKFEGFTGKIFSFSAWNTYLPQAAESQENLPGPDLSWDRSLVTVESLLRYLHAGRLDGKEPPVSLFPIDLDSGLSIQSILDQSHAKLTAAHAALAAAKEYAAHLKEVELAKARAKLQEETDRLVNAQLQAKAEKEKAEVVAKAKKDEARRLKSNASQKAKEERARNARNVKEIKDTGQAKADAKVLKATEEKDRKVAVANSRLSGKKNELEKKKGEYEKK